MVVVIQAVKTNTQHRRWRRYRALGKLGQLLAYQVTASTRPRTTENDMDVRSAHIDFASRCFRRATRDGVLQRRDLK